MDDLATLEHLSEECERLERFCRHASPRLAKLLLILAWFAAEEAQQISDRRAHVR